MAPVDRANTIVGIKGAGEMATGVAIRLQRSGFSKLFMLEIAHPLAVRRTVSFCEAIHDGQSMVEGVASVRARNKAEIFNAWKKGEIPVLIDPQWRMLQRLQVHVVVDAVIAKRNLGTTMGDAPLVIGLGPGFTAQADVHRVIETMRGHDLGRVIDKGSAGANTGIPGSIGGYTWQRVLRAPATGLFHSDATITDSVRAGDRIGHVDGKGVHAGIDGVVRGLIRNGSFINAGVKIGDIDPRGCVAHCFTVSDKARAIGGGVLEAIMGAYDASGWK